MQAGWTYLDDNCRQHSVGIYHGDQSGHLMVYCDMRIVQVDFSVKESRTYSFFIDNELCEMQLILGSDGKFSYDFVINKDADTPRNVVRKQEARRDRKVMWGLAVLGVAVVVIVFSLYRYNGERKKMVRFMETGISSELTPENARRLQREGQTAVATLFLVENDNKREIWYTFKTDDSVAVTCKVEAPGKGNLIMPNGLGFHDRDEFEVTYVANRPQINTVNCYRPRSITLNRYVEDALVAEKQAHPDDSPERVLCRVSKIIEKRSWPALKIIMRQQSGEADDANAYLRLIRDVDMEKALQMCPF